jgi:hypothetical protein
MIRQMLDRRVMAASIPQDQAIVKIAIARASR